MLVFGCGLIGSSVVRHLIWNDYAQLKQFDSRWSEPSLHAAQNQAITEYVTEIAGGGPADLHMVWSAGRGGFASNEDELENERLAFQATARLFEQLLLGQPATFHFISTAGGLFEGQRLVTNASRPDPRRPYGHMKLSQEDLISGLAGQPRRMIRIYRPSTVYGAREFDYRSGLISHLIWNALRNSPTTLEPNIHALRDYVFVDDVGRFITDKIREGFTRRRHMHYLVSGKPSSIFEVIQRVQRMLGRTLIYRYSDRCRNDADITFSGEIKSNDWIPTSLDHGLSEVFRKTANIYLQKAVV